MLKKTVFWTLVSTIMAGACLLSWNPCWAQQPAAGKQSSPDASSAQVRLDRSGGVQQLTAQDLVLPVHPVRIEVVGNSLIISATTLEDGRRVRRLAEWILQAAAGNRPEHRIVQLRALHPKWVASLVQSKYRGLVNDASSQVSVSVLGNSRLSLVGSPATLDTIEAWIEELDR